MVSITRPRIDSKTAAERDKDGSHSKLVPKTYGPFKVVQTFDNTVAVDLDGVHTQVALDRLTRAPDERDTQRIRTPTPTTFRFSRVQT